MSLYLGGNLISGVATPVQGARNIGQIIQSTIPLTDAGLHLLDGSLISGSGAYADFVDYIGDIYDASSNYFCSEADWQTSVTNYGVCGKFVYDSVNDTVRLPKIEGFTEGTTDVTALGDLIEAGLPNITGNVGKDTGIGHVSNVSYGVSVKDTQCSGAFYQNNNCSYTATNQALQGSDGKSLGFDASGSNPIYGASSTVQPQAIKVLYYIVIATSTKTQIEVDIDEIATDLNGKADTDLVNVTDSGKILLSSMGMPSNKYTRLTLGAAYTYYTSPANGYFVFCATSSSSSVALVELSCSQLFTRCISYSNSTRLCVYMPAKKGDSVRAGYTNIQDTFFVFVYAEGSKSEAS